MKYGYLLLCLFAFIPSLTFAERIQTFSTNIELRDDSSFVVTERIEYVFTEDRHGIFRYIPTKHPQEATQWYKDRYVEIDVQEVIMDGGSVPFEVSKESEQVFIKIGDPNTTISGTHIYEIEYLVRGGLSFINYVGAELYWDVTGNEWSIPIRNVEVSVSASEGVLTGQHACYRGLFGSTASCSRTSEENGQIVFRASDLGPREGITVALAIDETKVKKVILEKNRIFILLTPFIILWLFLLSYFVYRYKIQHRTGRTIITHYEPYKDFKPMYAGLLFDGTLNPEDITACIVYLAEQGFLTIKKINKKVLFFFEVDDYEISLEKSLEEVESSFRHDVLTLLFGNSPQIGGTVAFSKLKSDMSKQRKNQKILRELKSDLKKDLVRAGFFKSSGIRYFFQAGLAVLIVFASTSGLLFLSGDLSQGVVIVLVSTFIVSVGILSISYRVRTKKGYEARDYLEGFKQFLSVTEKRRYAFHNAPEKSPQQFMEYLPYAIAFGVEKEWAKVFKDITIPDPSWYEAGTAGSFLATNLTTSLGAFSTAFAASSGSSGGASGGGSVGGGGGGGGGGSW